jgi:hypothetical protein
LSQGLSKTRRIEGGGHMAAFRRCGPDFAGQAPGAWGPRDFAASDNLDWLG